MTTPLDIACHIGNFSCARALLRARQWDLHSNDHLVLALSAKCNGWARARQDLSTWQRERTSFVRVFILAFGNSPPDIYYRPSTCKPHPLIVAAKIGSSEDLRVPLSLGSASVDQSDHRGKTALMHAVQRGHVDVARILLHAGASVNARDEENMTAIEYAPKLSTLSVYDEKILTDRKSIYLLLLHHGASLGGPEKADGTSYHEDPSHVVTFESSVLAREIRQDSWTRSLEADHPLVGQGMLEFILENSTKANISETT